MSAPRDIDSLDKKELLAAIQQTGIAGLGGATFPAHVKLNVPADAVIDTLVVNGAECEPFLTCDHRVMVERTQDLMRGIRYALKMSGAPRAIIGVEDNKPDAIAAIQAALPADGTISVQGAGDQISARCGRHPHLRPARPRDPCRATPCFDRRADEQRDDAGLYRPAAARR